MRNETPDPLALSERGESNGIDALIDEAARRLVAGEPSSSLRSSVRDRIGKRRVASFAVPAWGMAAAIVVAVLIVGRALLGPAAGPDKARPTRFDNVRAANHSGTNSNVAAVAQSIDPGATQPARIEPRQLARRLAADVAAPPEEEPIVPPIAIEPLKTVQIAVDVSSGVMPIDIAPLQIEPLLGQ